MATVIITTSTKIKLITTTSSPTAYYQPSCRPSSLNPKTNPSSPSSLKQKHSSTAYYNSPSVNNKRTASSA